MSTSTHRQSTMYRTRIEDPSDWKKCQRKCFVAGSSRGGKISFIVIRLSLESRSGMALGNLPGEPVSPLVPFSPR